MTDFLKFPSELVVCMQAGCSPEHPLTPTFCLDIMPRPSNDRSRTAKYRLAEQVDQIADLAAKALEAEWTEHGGPVFTCSGCHGWTFQRVHEPECRVDAALTALGYPDRESRDRAHQKLREDDFKERWPSMTVWSKDRDPDGPTPSRHIPDSPTSDPDFDSDPDDGGD